LRHWLHPSREGAQKLRDGLRGLYRVSLPSNGKHKSMVGRMQPSIDLRDA
jgi:hypothetical protein